MTGGASYGDKCACGTTNSCADPEEGCNCDKNDNPWREDIGLLTDKSHLAVSHLAILVMMEKKYIIHCGN